MIERERERERLGVRGLEREREREWGLVVRERERLIHRERDIIG